MHTLLKFLKCRWLISQNIAYFQLVKNPQISRNLNKTAYVKIRGNFQYFGSFQVFCVWLGRSALYTSRKSLIGAKMSKQG